MSTTPTWANEFAGEVCDALWNHLDSSMTAAQAQIIARMVAERFGKPAVRKPVGVAMVPESQFKAGATLVVCDDGSAWWADEGRWTQYYHPIPGTLAAKESEG